MISIVLSLQDDINGLYPEQFDDVMDFIEATIGRLRRSPAVEGGLEGRKDKGRQRGAANTERGGRGRGERKKGRGRG